MNDVPHVEGEEENSLLSRNGKKPKKYRTNYYFSHILRTFEYINIISLNIILKGTLHIFWKDVFIN